MEKTVIKTGKTVDEAIEAALSELGCTKEQATIEVVEEGTEGGFLGLGRKDAEVKVTFNSEESGEAAPAAESDDDTYFGDDESFEGDAVSEAEDAAANFVAEVLSGIGNRVVVISVQPVTLYYAYQLLVILAVLGIVGFLQAFCPSFVVGNLKFEQFAITLSAYQETRVVLITLIYRIVRAEAVVFPVVIMIHSLSVPVMALYAEMIVGLSRQFAVSCARL